MSDANVAKIADVIVRHEPEMGHREAYCSCGVPIGEWAREWPEHIGGIIVRMFGLDGPSGGIR